MDTERTQWTARRARSAGGVDPLSLSPAFAVAVAATVLSVGCASRPAPERETSGWRPPAIAASEARPLPAPVVPTPAPATPAPATDPALETLPTIPGMEPAARPGASIARRPSQTQRSRLEEARTAASNEEYDAALRIFRELLDENPMLAGAYAGMGAALEGKGEIELAENAYARALTLDPSDFEASAGYSRVLELQGRTREAIRALQRTLTIRPRDVDANVSMARLLLATDQLPGAVAFAERAVRIDPQSGTARLMLARSYLTSGRGADAIREYESACELVEPPIDALLALINAYATEKRYQEAANAADALSRAYPSAAAFERLGWARFRLNEFAASQEAYRRSIELDPEYWPALNGVGVNVLNQWVKGGKNPDSPLRDEARAVLQRSLRANPEQPRVVALLMKYQL